MESMELGEVQLRFAELVWHYAPLPSGEPSSIKRSSKS